MNQLPKSTQSAWDAWLGLVVHALDRLTLMAVPLVALLVPSQRGHSAGIFFFQNELPRWDAWAEPGAFTIRLGRVELQIDRPIVQC